MTLDPDTQVRMKRLAEIAKGVDAGTYGAEYDDSDERRAAQVGGLRRKTGPPAGATADGPSAPQRSRRSRALNTNRTTTRRPIDLSVDSLITAYPDPRDRDRYGTPGRWTVTQQPADFDSWVRVDAHDDEGHNEGHRDVVWFLPYDQDVAVELSGPEMLAQAIQLVATWAAERVIPTQMQSWEVARDGLRGQIAAWTSDGADCVHEHMEVWARFLGADEVTSTDTDYGFTSLMVKAVVAGVPVAVRASIRTPVSESVEAVADGSK